MDVIEKMARAMVGAMYEGEEGDNAARIEKYWPNVVPEARAALTNRGGVR